MDAPVQHIISSLNHFFDHWSAVEQKVVPLSEREQVFEVLSRLEERGKSLQGGEELGLIIRPLLCKTKDQQERFVKVFSVWYSNYSAITNTDKKGEAERSEPDEESKALIPPWVLLAALLVVGGIGAYFAWKKPATQQQTSVITSIDLPNDQTIYSIQNERNVPVTFRSPYLIDSIHLEFETDLKIKKFLIPEKISNSFSVTNPYSNEILIIADPGKPQVLIYETTLITLNFEWSDPSSSSESIYLSAEIFSEDARNSWDQFMNRDSIGINLYDPYREGGDSINFTYFPIRTIYMVLIIVGLISVIIPFIILPIINRLSYSFLQKRLPYRLEETQVHQLFYNKQLQEIPELWDWTPRVKKLNYREKETSSRFDFRKTLLSTSRKCGIFTPVFSPPLNEPHYLALIDRQSLTDLQADFSLAYIQVLQESDIRVTIAYFDQDPRKLYFPDDEKWYSLWYVQEQFRNHSVLFFSTLHDIYDPFSGRLGNWTDALAGKWTDINLFSPENLRPFHQRYRELAKLGLDIHPLSSAGFRSFIEEREITHDLQIENRLSHFLPSLIANQTDTWISTFPPEEDEIVELQESLSEFLGVNGMLWLRACAVFPEIFLELTLFLGKELKQAQNPGRSLFHPALFGRLTQLPWMREGRMPDWQRKELINGLSSKEKRAVKEAIEQFFFENLPGKRELDKLDVRKGHSLYQELASRFFSIFRSQQTQDSSLKEAIFADFMKGSIGMRIMKKLLHPVSLYSGKTLFYQLGELIKGLLLIAGGIFVTVFTFGFIWLFVYWPKIRDGVRMLVSMNREESDKEVPIKGERGEEPLKASSSQSQIVNEPTLDKSLPTKWYQQPWGFWVLFFTEMWQRFSYYGMRAILVLYMVEFAFEDNPGLEMESEEAMNIYGWFTMLALLIGVLGGYLGDQIFGQKRSILLGNILSILGFLLLAIDKPNIFYIGLGLVALGSGLYRTNILAIAGSLYRNKVRESRDLGYYLIYIAINIGAILGAWLIVLIGKKFSWQTAFILTAFGSAISYIIFYLGLDNLTGVGNRPGRKSQIHIPSIKFGDLTIGNIQSERKFNLIREIFLHRNSIISFFLVLSIGIFALSAGDLIGGFAFISFAFIIGISMAIYNNLNSTKEKGKVRILAVASLLNMCFWSTFSYAGGTLGAFVYEGTTNSIGPINLPDSFYQYSNGVLILLLSLPIAMLWVQLRSTKRYLSSIYKIGIGILVIGIGWIVLSAVSSSMDSTIGVPDVEKVSSLWLLSVYLLHTLGEVIAIPIAYSLISRMAPVKWSGFFFGVFIASAVLGNHLVNILISSIQGIQNWSTAFAVTGAFCIIIFLLVLVRRKPLQGLTHGMDD